MVSILASRQLQLPFFVVFFAGTVCQVNERLFALYCALTALLFDTVIINNRNRA